MNWNTEFGLLTVNVATFHLNQTRKGKNIGLKIPYIIHPLQILRRIQNWGIIDPTEENKSLWKATLFHDSIEDTCISYEYLESMIGIQATKIVSELTYIPSKDFSKDDYLNSFSNKSIESLVIKIADRLCNVDDFRNDIPEYAYRYLLKAEGLFKEVLKSKIEIEERFGNIVFTNIEQDIKSYLNENGPLQC